MNTQQFFRYLKGKTVAFCGVGRTHMPLIKLFQEKGAVVTVRDQRPLEKLGENGEILRSLGVELRLGEDYLQDLNEDIIFRTPGMRYHLPQLEEARARGCAVTSELELFFRLCPCKIYGVTGSDGKTTTTSIIAEFLKAQGRTVHLGGTSASRYCRRSSPSPRRTWRWWSSPASSSSPCGRAPTWPW